MNNSDHMSSTIIHELHILFYSLCEVDTVCVDFYGIHIVLEQILEYLYELWLGVGDVFCYFVLEGVCEGDLGFCF